MAAAWTYSNSRLETPFLLESCCSKLTRKALLVIRQRQRKKYGISTCHLSNPKGGKYQINLEDGTKVWLNAESSLIFPEHFAADRRLVQVKGEAYFEVAESKHKPFIVAGNGFGIRVLGTKFNVSDRDNLHLAKVALLQGSVSLTSKAGHTMLKPGERAKISASGVQIDQFDAESEIAWKNNYFIYKDENIKTIMADVAQWYDAEVIFEGKDWDDVNLKMKVSRRENIEEILSLLELTKSVKFKIVERRIYVTKR
ncbi:FecR domain-containing protein [Sphingobacterium sp. E70]|uniref:FecR family protein n=1 Tax=Sphingobacterium sp. E70 TaxID=2853439 RepID=UPI00211C56E1|nr:FecR family protein [Sphingobacterium sp. E70]ULT24277.1 FecR domain-containing protein [Sphingobacterium sp. E70]